MLRKPNAMMLLALGLIILLGIVINMPDIPDNLHSIKVSYSDLNTERSISNSEQLKIFVSLLNDDEQLSPMLWYGRKQVTLSIGTGDYVYSYDGKYLYNNAKSTRLQPDEQTVKLLNDNFEVLARDTFATIKSWSQVNKLLPVKSTARIYDLETGLSFMVQRRAGTYHADVQPLTEEDTAIMKDIFKDKWTWKRRAIIVQTGNIRIAASMNGMPHGQGALRNNFPGHFCIHFYNSLTHGSRSRDTAHHIMIAKAGGTLESHLKTATPLEVANTFLLGMEQQDQYLLKVTSKIIEPKDLSLLDNLDNWEDINFETPKLKDDAHTKMFYVIPVELGLLPKNSNQRTYLQKSLVLTRETLTSPWLIDLRLSL